MALSGLLSAVESIQVRTLLPQVPNLLLLSAQTPNLLFLASQRTQIQGALTGFTSLSPLLGSGIIAHLIALATPPTFTNIVTLATPPTYTNVTTLTSGTTFLNLSSIGALPSVSNLVTLGGLPSVANLVTLAGYTSTGMGNLTTVAGYTPTGIANLSSVAGASSGTISNILTLGTGSVFTNLNAIGTGLNTSQTANLTGFFTSPNYPTLPLPAGGGFPSIGAWFTATFAAISGTGILGHAPLTTLQSTAPLATSPTFNPNNTSFTLLLSLERLAIDISTPMSFFANAEPSLPIAGGLTLSLPLLVSLERSGIDLASPLSGFSSLALQSSGGDLSGEQPLLANVETGLASLAFRGTTFPVFPFVGTLSTLKLGVGLIQRFLGGLSSLNTLPEFPTTATGAKTPLISAVEYLIYTSFTYVGYSIASTGTLFDAMATFFSGGPKVLGQTSTRPSGQFPVQLGVATDVIDVLQSLSDWAKNGPGIQGFLDNLPGPFHNEEQSFTSVGKGSSFLSGHKLGIAAGTFLTGNNGLGGATGIEWWIAWKSGVTMSTISGPDSSGNITVTWSDGSTTTVATGQAPTPGGAAPGSPENVTNPAPNISWNNFTGMLSGFHTATDEVLDQIGNQSNWSAGPGGNILRIDAKADFHRWMFDAFADTMSAELTSIFSGRFAGLLGISPGDAFPVFGSFRNSPPSGLPGAGLTPAGVRTTQVSFLTATGR